MDDLFQVARFSDIRKIYIEYNSKYTAQKECTRGTAQHKSRRKVENKTLNVIYKCNPDADSLLNKILK